MTELSSTFVIQFYSLLIIAKVKGIVHKKSKSRVPQTRSWRATVLQILAPTLIKQSMFDPPGPSLRKPVQLSAIESPIF